MPIQDVQPYINGAGDGSPGVYTLPGSGYAVPAGLEATLEYNGIFMNVHSNIDHYRITSFDGLGDADIRDARDVNTNDDGETPYNAFYGGRTLVITGTIETYSVAKLRDMQMALKQAFADLKTEKPLHFRTGDFQKDHFIMCRKVASIAATEQQQNLMVKRDFQISLRASNPRFLSYYQRFAETSPPYSIMNPVEIMTVHNRGNYEAQPVFRIYGSSLQQESATTLTNGRTGKSFSIKSIPWLDYVEFDMAAKSLKDSAGRNVWNKLGDDSDYVYMLPGDNPILYAGDAGRVRVSWRDSWI